MSYTLEEKIKLIEDSSSLSEVQDLGIMPDPDQSDGYYFVSYSHSDYKTVFPAILALQRENVKLWYDRGLETGKSWLRDVRRHISSYYCKGVLFFVGDAALLSASVWAEIYATIKNKKHYAVVDLRGDGASDTFDEVPDEEARGYFVRLFGTARGRSRLFFRGSAAADIAAALLSMPKPRLFTYGRTGADGEYAIVRSVADVSLKKAEIPAYAKLGGERIPVIGVDERCFANCTELKEVSLPDGWTTVAPQSFYNCVSLERVTFGEPGDDASISLDAFFGCDSLCVLEVPAGVNLCKYDLTELDRPERIVFLSGNARTEWSSDFRGCVGLREVVGLPETTTSGAFTMCRSLERIELPQSCRTVDDDAFCGCGSLREIRLPKNVRTVRPFAFADCKMLEECVFEGDGTDICAFAFLHCTSLVRLELPCKKLSAGIFAFAGCTSLREVALTAEQTALNVTAFAGCNVSSVIVCCRKLTIEPLEKTSEEFLSSTDDIGLLRSYDIGAETKEPHIDDVFRSAKTFYVADEIAMPGFSSPFCETDTDRPGFRKFIKE